VTGLQVVTRPLTFQQAVRPRQRQIFLHLAKTLSTSEIEISFALFLPSFLSFFLPPSSPPHTWLLSLPFEPRSKVYPYIFDNMQSPIHPNVYNGRPKPSLAVLQACHQTRSETLPPTSAELQKVVAFEYAFDRSLRPAYNKPLSI
jgi:hypothetical protein